MKPIKIYLTLVTVLLCISIGFGIYVWYLIQTFDSKTENILNTNEPTQKVDLPAEITDTTYSR